MSHLPLTIERSSSHSIGKKKQSGSFHPKVAPTKIQRWFCQASQLWSESNPVPMLRLVILHHKTRMYLPNHQNHNLAGGKKTQCDWCVFYPALGLVLWVSLSMDSWTFLSPNNSGHVFLTVSPCSETTFGLTGKMMIRWMFSLPTYRLDCDQIEQC